AKLLHIESQFAGGETLPLLLLGVDTLLRGFGHLNRFRAVHGDYAIIVGNNHVTRLDSLASDNDWHIYRAQARLDGALCPDVLAPDRKLHLRQRRHVANAR